ncbi:unnamed protein product [Brassica oleracea var. botrytis]
MDKPLGTFFILLLISPIVVATINEEASFPENAHLTNNLEQKCVDIIKVDPSLKFENDRLKRAYIALQAWKKAIYSDPFKTTKNWVGPDVCSYNGVYCAESLDDPSLKVVAGVDLNHADIAGHLPAELGLITDLAMFHINSNRFCGIIPKSFSKLALMYEFDVSNNRFVGSFPEVSLSWPSLKFLDLRYNEFEGCLPSEIFDKNLDAIFFNNNRFESVIPDTIGKSAASVVTFANNKFSGCIPISIGQMKNLNEVIFTGNNLTGCFPNEIGSLNNVTVFDASNNGFVGSLPLTLSSLSSVEQLDLSNNKLTGSVVDTFCKLPNLESFKFSYNYFNGEAESCVPGKKNGKQFDDRSNCLKNRPNQKSVNQCVPVVSRPVDCSKDKCSGGSQGGSPPSIKTQEIIPTKPKELVIPNPEESPKPESQNPLRPETPTTNVQPIPEHEPPKHESPKPENQTNKPELPEPEETPKPQPPKSEESPKPEQPKINPPEQKESTKPEPPQNSETPEPVSPPKEDPDNASPVPPPQSPMPSSPPPPAYSSPPPPAPVNSPPPPVASPPPPPVNSPPPPLIFSPPPPSPVYSPPPPPIFSPPPAHIIIQPPIQAPTPVQSPSSESDQSPVSSPIQSPTPIQSPNQVPTPSSVLDQPTIDAQSPGQTAPPLNEPASSPKEAEEIDAPEPSLSTPSSSPSPSENVAPPPENNNSNFNLPPHIGFEYGFLGKYWQTARSFNSANGSRVFVTLCDLKAKDETILTPAAEYRKCHSSLARENFDDFPGSRKTRVINFVVLPALGGKRPSAVGESSPAIIRPQTTPAVMKKSKLSQTTVRRRPRSSGEELPERPPAKQQRYPVVIPQGGQFSDGVPSSVLPRRLFAYGDGCDGHFDGFPILGAVSASRCTLPELYEAHRLPPQPTARYGSQTRVLVHLRARSTTVLRMLGNEYLAVEKRLPLALIALVDGVLCPSNKDLKLTPRYVEMMSDVESFLVYPWGRESFLTTVLRFLPPLVVAPGENPLQVMRDRLSQKTTVCYGFPLALQLFVFDDVPLLLEKIPDAGNTATFIDSPGACSLPSTILTVNEIVAVEEDPDLSVHFTVIPDVELLLLADQNEDRQVTSLRFEGMENNIEELRTLICKSLGLPEGSKRNARKRKAMDDPQVRRTLSPDDSIVSEIEGRNRKGKKRKTVGTRHVGKKTLPRRRSGGGKEEVSRKNPPSSERVSGHQNDDDHAKENESDNARFPPSGRNKGDQQQETQSNALVLFGDVLDVEPESYVLPAEVRLHLSYCEYLRISSTFQHAVTSPVAWEKTKPNCYSSVGSVRSFHPSWDGNPSSKSKVASTGIETCPLLIIS